VASLSQGRTAAVQCSLFTYKSVPVIFEPSCILKVFIGIFLIVLHYHLTFLLTEHECAPTSDFRNLFTSQYIGSLQPNWNTHQLLYFLQPSLSVFFLILISTIKPYHTPYFIFTNNNNLPLLQAANENKLFRSFVNICEQAFRWWCVREHGATQQLDMSHTPRYPSLSSGFHSETDAVFSCK